MNKPRAALIIVAVLLLIAGSIGTIAATAAPPKNSEADFGTVAPKDKEYKDHKNHSVHADVLTVAASVLEMDKEEVKEAVKSGKVGDLLIAAGKLSEFKAAYLSEFKTKLDAAVAAGKLTQEKADGKYGSEKTKIEAYDGTTHLCGNGDHSKMSDKKTKTSGKAKTA